MIGPVQHTLVSALDSGLWSLGLEVRDAIGTASGTVREFDL